MPSWLGFILFMYAAVALVLTIIELGIMGADIESYPSATPITLHEYSDMNWVGCVCCWILLGLISPIAFVIKLFYFLFHL